VMSMWLVLTEQPCTQSSSKSLSLKAHRTHEPRTAKIL
jgi:hypothetical protein